MSDDEAGEAAGQTAVSGSWNRDDYQVGAIMRVYLRNFLTYDKAEFVPGPYLNMVIGPNGTGKSSLVNAICLGLGFSPKLLARGSSIGEFVKYNKPYAIIETKLRGPQDRSINIRVKIIRESNSTVWHLDGTGVSHKRIQEVVKSLRIQVDNLCQFLPQDRVVEFARLNDVELLTETLRAAAPEEVSETHRQLLEQHKAKEDLQKRIAVTQAELQSKEQRQSQMQAEVDRIRERDEIALQIKKYEAAIVYAKYEQITQEFAEIKRKKKRATEALKRLENESQPALEAADKKKLYLEHLQRLKRKASEDVQLAEAEVVRFSKAFENMQGSLKVYDEQLTGHTNGYNSAKKEIMAIQRELTSLKGQLKSDLPELDLRSLNEEIRMKRHQNRERESEQTSLRQRSEEFKKQREHLTHQQQQVQRQIEDLDSQEGQRLQKLTSLSPDAAKGYRWLRENQSMFEKEVFGPVLLTCNVKDERYVDQVEEYLGKSDLTCFTTQCTADHKKLSEIFFRKMGISVTIRTTTTPLSSYKAPLSQEQVTNLGIDGFLAEYIQGPEPVIAMLCNERRLHATIVSLRNITEEALSQFERHPHISQLVIGDQAYKIARRRLYGNMSTTTSKVISRAKWLVNNQGGTISAKASLEKRMAELEDDQSQLSQTAASLKQRFMLLRGEMQETEAELNELEKKKSEYQKEKVRLDNIPIRIEQHEERLKIQTHNMEDHQRQIDTVKVKRRMATIPLIDASVTSVRILATFRSRLRKRSELEIYIIEAQSDIRYLEGQSAGVQLRLAAEKEKVKVLEEQYVEVRNRGYEQKSLVQDTKELFGDQQEEIDELWKDKPLEEVVGCKEAEQARLQMLSTGNPATLELYKRLAEEIQRLSAQLENGKSRMVEFMANIESKQRNWEPQVETLVRKISMAFGHNFEQINCAGEVHLHKAEVFQEWALHIKVCFRVNEPDAELVQLTGNRQSGGERSVSTIFFLMALQADAQSPFRVVDEINQGMDPRNERMVHNRMVQIACQEHSCQYFLITPKLLTNLNYHEKMTVLCIVSGPKVPDVVMKVDFGAILEKRRALIAAGSG